MAETELSPVASEVAPELLSVLVLPCAFARARTDIKQMSTTTNFILSVLVVTSRIVAGYSFGSVFAELFAAQYLESIYLSITKICRF